jgi:NAD(P)-dependent dehydrogenase (short-subunit alcohol dehydrogenase family)
VSGQDQAPPGGRVTGFADGVIAPTLVHTGAAVAFPAREDSRFITGQILSVNGGSSMS